MCLDPLLHSLQGLFSIVFTVLYYNIPFVKVRGGNEKGAHKFVLMGFDCNGRAMNMIMVVNRIIIV